ncbi:MAG: DegT/DnrJ/EryC1/StrS family aminotransferase [Aliishimia sp.]
MLNVNANSFDRMWDECGPDCLDAVSRVGSSGWYILGAEVADFEEKLAKSCNCFATVGCASGLDAIEIALRTNEIQPGDKVLTTPLSAFATVLAVLRTGAIPVFCDVDANGLLDSTAAANAFAHYPDIKAIIPVHLYGQLADMNAFSNLAKTHGVILIEDAAQAIGATRGEIRVGELSHAACLSFYPTKNLGALGDAGAVILSDATQVETAKSLRNYGQTEKYGHDILGLNSRLDEVHAATLKSAFLPRLNGWLARRREIAQLYLEGITNPAVTLMPGPDRRGSGWHLFPVLVAAHHREDFMDHLAAKGVQGGLHYPVLMSDQKALTDLGTPLISGSLRMAQSIAEQEVSLPIHPYLTPEEIEHVVAAVNAWDGQ